MFWQDESGDRQDFVVPDNIVDVLYAIECRCLPLDHAHALSQALLNALPWLPNEPQAGIHLIHVAESGNGWYRPEDPDNEVLVVSRRTRMALRLPKERNMAKTIHETPMLDELEQGPWPSFISGIKRLRVS